MGQYSNANIHASITEILVEILRKKMRLEFTVLPTVSTQPAATMLEREREEEKRTREREIHR